MIERTGHLRALTALLRQFPVVAILGPRQIGKTTLARQLVNRRGGRTTFFDLESSEDLALLVDPLLALRPLKGLVVVDEVHRRPELFPSLRVLVDEPRAARRFLVLGSASPDLLRQTSETLAGRIAYHELAGFTLDEVGTQEGLACGAEADSPVRISPAPSPRASAGAGNSFERTWNGTFPRSAFACPRPHCADSGTWSRTTMDKCGMPPSWRAPSGSGTQPSSDTSIS